MMLRERYNFYAKKKVSNTVTAAKTEAVNTKKN